MFKTVDSWLKILVILAAVYLLSQVTSLYLPVIISIILAFILNPVVNYFAHYRLWPFNRPLGRGTAVLLAFLVTAVVMTVILMFILVPFVNEFNNLVRNLPVIIKKFQAAALAVQNEVNFIAVAEHLPSFVEQAMSSATAYSLGLAKRIVNSIFSVATGIIELIIVPVLTYYFLKDWKLIKDNIVLLFSKGARSKARNIIEEMGMVISGYIRGQFIVSIVVGVLVFGGMYSFGVEYPLVLGLLAAITESIPIIGPIIGAVPAILLAYLVEPVLAIKVIIFYILVQQLENHIVVPKIMGHAIDLHPVAVIIGLLVGGQLFGIAGMILAVPVTAILKVILSHLWIKDER